MSLLTRIALGRGNKARQAVATQLLVNKDKAKVKTLNRNLVTGRVKRANKK